MKEIFRGVYKIGGSFATLNYAPSRRVYGEKLIRRRGKEFRVWDPYRSKLAAALHKGLKTFCIKPGDKVLYLGVATGTTASHVSDIVGEDGIVYCIDVSPRVLRELVLVCKERDNMIPILADASKPYEYASIVEEVDVIYQDVAQPNQSEILVKNADVFLKEEGYAILMIKARSIDVTKEPSDVFKREMDILAKHLKIVEKLHLEPYDKDHAAVICKK